MKLNGILPAVMIAATSLSFSALSANEAASSELQTQVQTAHDQEAAFNSIMEFEANSRGELSTSAYERCSATVYTRYTSIKLGDTRTIASFDHDGGNCHRYGFAILRNYEGHDFKVTLVDSNGQRVAGGYSVAVSTSIYQTGRYYWQVENLTTSSSKTYGGIKYEVRSGG